MKNLKDLDNIEFVTHIMATGSPMNQIFVIDALEKWSNYIIKHEKEVIEQFKDTMIHGPAWVDAAKHVQSMLKKRHE